MDKPRLIASDVDGTLLDPMERLSARTRAAVHSATADGVPFVLVSGRPPRYIPPVSSATGVSGYAVCANGAVLYDLAVDRAVTVRGLDPLLLHDVATALDTALPGCRFAAERIATHAEDAGVRNFVRETAYHNPWGDSDDVTAPRAEVLGHAAVKLLVSMREMTSDEMVTAAEAALDGTVDVTFSSGSGLIEIAPRGVTKATGIAEVADRLGVCADDTIAFGDMPNDVDMLRWSGHGVAMANAHPSVRAIADEITAPNTEDGVAQVLERWF